MDQQCKLGALQRHAVLQGVFVTIGDFVKFKGFLVEFLKPTITRSPAELHTFAGTPCRATRVAATRVAADVFGILGCFRCSSGIALQPPPPPPKCPVAPVALRLPGASHVKLPLKRCSRYRGCSSYTCGCRATLWNYGRPRKSKTPQNIAREVDFAEPCLLQCT